MNDHYYSQEPQSAHRYAETAYVYRGAALRFVTDAGVFSRGEVDFGTDALLNALPESIQGRVLDLGCGWGAVGVSVGKRYPDCRIVMSDVNRRALELAEQNAKANGVRARTVESDGCESVEGPFDFIVTNPPIRAGKQVIYKMFADCEKLLTPDGVLYLVIRRQQGAESALKYLKTIFTIAAVVEKSGGFWVIRCGRAAAADGE